MIRRYYFLQVVIILVMSLFYPFCFAETKVKESSAINEDVDKCFVEVGKMLSNEDVEEFKSATSNEVANYRYTIGRLIRNNCGLLEDTKLKEYFIERNIESSDDMALVVLKCYYLHLNNLEFDLSELIDKFKGEDVGY